MTDTKIFLETSVILGAAQIRVFENSPELMLYVNKNLIKKPEMYISSQELTDKLLSNPQKFNVEPFVSALVKDEVRTIVNNSQKLQYKILRPLRIEEIIKKLKEEDRKIFELILYKIFIIKLPLEATDLIDKFSSTMVDNQECESIRDKIYSKVYCPLLSKHKTLYEYFELSGTPELFKKHEDDYEFLCKALVALEHTNKDGNKSGFHYKRLNDLRILAEAIFAYQKMIREYKEKPNFYFVSNDKIFVPLRTSSGKVHKEISELIKQNFEINIASSKFMLQELLKIEDGF